MAYIVSGGGAFDEMPDLYRIIMYAHVCEKKGPASAASASALEVASVFFGHPPFFVCIVHVMGTDGRAERFKSCGGKIIDLIPERL